MSLIKVSECGKTIIILVENPTRYLFRLVKGRLLPTLLNIL
uniref:Uncharacterized protein n=1 Tax=Vibrio tasmaniensis TaxID=212663 RepID=A0A0H3ZPX9_9VIBR|nr:hypothetical protein [Vibrio tasmaniensis]